MIGSLFVFLSNAKVAREVVVTELGSNDDDRRNAWDGLIIYEIQYWEGEIVIAL